MRTVRIQVVRRYSRWTIRLVVCARSILALPGRFGGLIFKRGLRFRLLFIWVQPHFHGPVRISPTFNAPALWRCNTWCCSTVRHNSHRTAAPAPKSSCRTMTRGRHPKCSATLDAGRSLGRQRLFPGRQLLTPIYFPAASCSHPSIFQAPIANPILFSQLPVFESPVASPVANC